MIAEDIRTDGRSPLHDLSDQNALSGFTTAVSLHAHTHYSCEVLVGMPGYLDRIPVVAALVRRELREYLERHGEAIDFAKGWWHPPVGPEEVWASEEAQIADVLGLAPLVSMTDHDSIEAPLTLRAVSPARTVPISFEWTVPFGGGYFHVGVHNLPPSLPQPFLNGLLGAGQPPDARLLTDVFAELHAYPDTLLVLNHPLWDLARVGAAHHIELLRQFLKQHGSWIHALELNGYRSGRENTAVSTLASTLALPLISGGDRHGRAPNSLLNLTNATCLADFVHEIREDQHSEVLVMPEYREALVTRKLAVAADVFRAYPDYPVTRRYWMNRISCECEGLRGPLSDHWPQGGPLWVRSAVRAFQLVTTKPMRPVVTALLDASRRTADQTSPAALIESSSGRVDSAPACAAIGQ